MFVYIVFEEKDYQYHEIVKVFSQEKDAKKYVEKNFWKDEEGYEGIYYVKQKVE